MKDMVPLLASVAVAVALLAACTSLSPSGPDAQLADGDVRLGRAALADYGCIACHTIPGVAGTAGHVGPPLDRFGLRSYIAGNLPNGQDNLVRWIMDPQGVEPGTAMPDLDVSEKDASNMAAYLLSLE